MSMLKTPTRITENIEAHKKWCCLLKIAQEVVEADVTLQVKAAKGLCMKERNIPPEVLGRAYAQYCDLINKMYDTYLNSVHLQRAPYMLEIISVLLKRLYELRSELVYYIVNDYIYLDDALKQVKMSPDNIEIVVPYHYAIESRADSLEQMLQTMWADAIARKNAPPPPIITEPELVKSGIGSKGGFHRLSSEPPATELTIESSVHIVTVEELIQTNIITIQVHERMRQWYNRDFIKKCEKRRVYYAAKVQDAPMAIRISAATIIHRVYREYMKIKRLREQDAKRDVILGIVPDPFRERKSYVEENNKMYEKRRQTRLKIEKTYTREMERENTRLIVFRKEDQIDDITDEVYEWFKEWYFGYEFFPQYPYPPEGGTIMLIRGEYPTIEEQKEEDERLKAAMKGKTKEMIKEEKAQALAEAEMKAILAKENAIKEAELVFKMKCNPMSDPGYKAKKSEVTDDIVEILKNYRASWSLLDSYYGEKNAEIVYGYMKSILTEDLMSKIHYECREYVDELMRYLETIGNTFLPRDRSKSTLDLNEGEVFNLGIITKPTAKLRDIYGDSNYAAYEYNIRDPDVKYPIPGYGDVKNRLLLSCIFGTGIAPGAKRNKSVMLIGPPRNGKSFLVDCVAGELNAVKIDVTPEVFSAVCKRPARMLNLVFLAARTFQPAVIFLKNIERVFTKKMTPEIKLTKAKKMKTPLVKMVKGIPADAKIIFIATCSFPLSAKVRRMMSIFSESILVPLTDHGTLQQYFYNRLQSIRSMPRDYCVQALARITRGYGFGLIIDVYNQVMTPERIVKLNITPLSPAEFLEVFIESGIEPVTTADYQEYYVDFFLKNSPLKIPRMEYEIINKSRARGYMQMAKKKQAEEKAKAEKKNQG